MFIINDFLESSIWYLLNFYKIELRVLVLDNNSKFISVREIIGSFHVANLPRFTSKLSILFYLFLSC